MNHNYTLFAAFYLLSCIPWLIASLTPVSKDTKWALFALDGALTIAAYVYLWHEIGGWWVLVVILAMGAVGRLMEEAGFPKGYEELFAKKGEENVPA